MNNNDNRPAAIVLAILMLVLPGSLIARDKRGATIVVTFKDGHFAEGELIAVKPDSLLLLAGKDETVALAEVRSIRVVRKSRALVGGLCGLAAGITAAAFASNEDFGPFDSSWSVLMGVLFVSSGVGLGAGAGALAGKDKVFWLEGMSESESRTALIYLRKKARIQKAW
ncbi:MAG: hypothetical protein HGA24_04415 [Candidatus Aminicenantes bacterium]|nr:hypothetical protein [Candidatus Aminicenantes bacterium]